MNISLHLLIKNYLIKIKENIDYFFRTRNIIKSKQRYKEKYNSHDILSKLVENGLKKGDTLFIHSSWDMFFNYEGTAQELITTLLDYLSEDGTLAMPCFPALQDHSAIFNLKRTPSGAGFLTEIFRRYKGTTRSINLNHSVCAIGKHAGFLTKDHHKSKTSWDKMSPYYRLKELDAMIVGLGVGHDLKVATALHCVESILRDEVYYFSMLFSEEVTYEYKDINGNFGKHTYLKRNGNIDSRKLAKYFNINELVEFRISNLEVYSVRAELMISRVIELGWGGITMYTKPKPNKDSFYKL